MRRPRRFAAPWLLLLVAGLAGTACRRTAVPVRDLDTRAVVIGIDGADWRIIDPLIEAGRMPHLVRLRERAAWGPIETLRDVPLSPVIWTSVATGRTAEEHGIAWFMVDRPDGSRVPVRSTNRKVRALWNILAENDRRPGVVGWWATYPAERLDRGMIVSDALGFHGFGSTARRGDDERKTWPPQLYRDVAPLIPPEQQLGDDFVRRFVHLTPAEYRREMFTPARHTRPDVTNPIHLLQLYAVTAQGYTAIAEKLLAEQELDLLLVYYEQVDSLSHLFINAAAPRLPWIDDETFARYRDAVEEWYVYQDELLGRLLQRIDLERTGLFILSDHGFKTGARRIRAEATVDVARAHLQHEPEGIFLAVGPHLRPGRVRGASVLDLAPTVLHYLGFPVSREMSGRVLEEVFTGAFRQRNPIRYVVSYEDEEAPAERRPAPAADSRQVDENLRALETLGYLGGESTGERETESSSPEMHNSLGRIHLRDGELGRARREFQAALELDPGNADALLNLAGVHAAEGRTAQAERSIRRALQVNPNSVPALAQLAELRRDQGDLEGASALFRQALEIDRQPYVYLGLGDVLQRAGRFDEAIAAFAAALELDPDSATAHYDLGVTYDRLGRGEEAVAAYERSLELQPEGLQAAQALNNLGAMAQDAGDLERAGTLFERAVDTAPRHLESLYNLAQIRASRGELDEAIALLERAAELQPNHQIVNLALGRAYLAVGRGEDAYRSFLLVRRLAPESWEAALGLAALHAGAGQDGEARRLLDEALRLGGAAAHSRANGYPALEPHL